MTAHISNEPTTTRLHHYAGHYSVGFHVGAAIAAFVVSSVAAFVCVWVFVTLVNVGVVAGA